MVSWKDAARDEAVGFERGLGDAEQHRRRFGGLAALFHDALRSPLSKSSLSIWSPQRKRGVARIGDLHLAQHLADDDLDVLVVNLTPWRR